MVGFELTLNLLLYITISNKIAIKKLLSNNVHFSENIPLRQLWYICANNGACATSVDVTHSTGCGHSPD